VNSVPLARTRAAKTGLSLRICTIDARHSLRVYGEEGLSLLQNRAVLRVGAIIVAWTGYATAFLAVYGVLILLLSTFLSVLLWVLLPAACTRSRRRRRLATGDLWRGSLLRPGLFGWRLAVWFNLPSGRTPRTAYGGAEGPNADVQ